jgi:hypothetical protein
VGELIVSSKGEFDGDTECFDGHDGDGAHCAAYGQVDERVLFAVFGGYSVDHEYGKDSGDYAVEHEAGLHGILEEAVDSFYLGIWGSV